MSRAAPNNAWQNRWTPMVCCRSCKWRWRTPEISKNKLTAGAQRRAKFNPRKTIPNLRLANVTAKIAPSHRKLKEAESLYIAFCAYANDFNASRTAMQLGVARSTLYAKLCAMHHDPSVLRHGTLALPAQPQERLNSDRLNWTLDETRCFHITTVFSAENYNVEKTVQRLGIGRSALYGKLK